MGGFIYNDSEVKFLDEVICLNLQDFLFEYEKVQSQQEEMFKNPKLEQIDPEISKLNQDVSNK